MGGTATAWPPPVKYPKLAERFRIARRASGLTLDQLADKVGSKRQHMIKLEKGWHAPRLEMRLKLAEAMGVSPELFEADE